MGITRTDLFTKEQNHLARLAKALGHPARIAILQHLLSATACINSDLVEELGLSQATISQHLKELKEIGLIRGTIEGIRMNYCIDAACWKETSKLIAAFFQRLELESPDCC